MIIDKQEEKYNAAATVETSPEETKPRNHQEMLSSSLGMELTLHSIIPLHKGTTAPSSMTSSWMAPSSKSWQSVLKKYLRIEGTLVSDLRYYKIMNTALRPFRTIFILAKWTTSTDNWQLKTSNQPKLSPLCQEAFELPEGDIPAGNLRQVRYGFAVQVVLDNGYRGRRGGRGRGVRVIGRGQGGLGGNLADRDHRVCGRGGRIWSRSGV